MINHFSSLFSSNEIFLHDDLHGEFFFFLLLFVSCNQFVIQQTKTCFFRHRFSSATPYKRAQTTVVTSHGHAPVHEISSSANVRRSYAPMSNTPANVVSNASTRKPRSFMTSATSVMKT